MEGVVSWKKGGSKDRREGGTSRQKKEKVLGKVTAYGSRLKKKTKGEKVGEIYLHQR